MIKPCASSAFTGAGGPDGLPSAAPCIGEACQLLCIAGHGLPPAESGEWQWECEGYPVLAYALILAYLCTPSTLPMPASSPISVHV